MQSRRWTIWPRFPWRLWADEYGYQRIHGKTCSVPEVLNYLALSAIAEKSFWQFAVKRIVATCYGSGLEE